MVVVPFLEAKIMRDIFNSYPAYPTNPKPKQKTKIALIY